MCMYCREPERWPARSWCTSSRPRLHCSRRLPLGPGSCLPWCPGGGRGPCPPCVPCYRLHDSRGVWRDVLLRELRRLLGQGVCELIPLAVQCAGTRCRWARTPAFAIAIRYRQTSAPITDRWAFGPACSRANDDWESVQTRTRSLGADEGQQDQLLQGPILPRWGRRHVPTMSPLYVPMAPFHRTSGDGCRWRPVSFRRIVSSISRWTGRVVTKAMHYGSGAWISTT